MVATTALFVKLFLTSAALGLRRFKVGGRPPEDGSIGTALKVETAQGLQVSSQATPEALAEFRRWERILANELENIPVGLACLWGSLLCLLFAAGSTAQQEQLALAHAVLSLSYAGARSVFTVCYAASLQPWRSVAFLVGLACTAGHCAVGLMALAF